MSRQVLIMGASGAAGSAMATAFGVAGWTVRPYQRGTDIVQAAQGVDLVVNAMNPPNYHDWARQIPSITALAMKAARASGARVLIPGNVYVYGQQAAPWTSATPHRPCSRKGQIRSEMEAAWRESGLPVTILRAGDFIAPARGGQVMGAVVLKGLEKGRITALGAPGARRAYAFLPDFARAAVALSALEDLPRFADIPFAGHAFTMHDLAAEIAGQTGKPVKIGQFPWWIIHLAAPFWELGRELLEMRYLFDQPHSLSEDQFARLVPQFRATPFPQVVAQAIEQP